MKNKIIFTILISILSVQGSESKCECKFLQSENDCKNFPLQSCEWQNNACQVSKYIQKQPIIESKPFCSQFNNQEDCLKTFICSNCQNKQSYCEGCLKQYPCIWDGGQCLFFTGCTVYAKTDSSVCNKFSKQCTTDSKQCIEFGKCTSYLTLEACKSKNIYGQSCKWDGQSKICQEFSNCADIPKELAKSHKDCQDQLNTCTIKSKAQSNEDNQCMELEQLCGNYTIEDQCKFTIYNIQCIWSYNECRQKKCEDAPNTYTTNEQCQNYNKTCYIKSDGGCQAIIQCGDFQNENDCKNKIDTNGKKCYWLSSYNRCVIHECDQVPSDYLTDAYCKSFKSDCISNSGKGCKINTGCSVFTTKQDCNTKTSVENKECTWDQQCKEKTCENASSELATHEQCQKFLYGCTTDNGVGCQDKTCSNAPSTIKTNDDCESYLPNQNCITKSGGGCTTNDSCSKVNTQIACKTDINGYECQWNSEIAECYTKQCNKAPTKYNTQSLCENFWSQCQVNESGTGCEDKVCENFRDQVKCQNQKDFIGKPCTWRGKCVERTCASATKEFGTHEQCNKYLNTCTLSLTGKGCMSFLLRCEFIKLEQGCRLRTSLDQNNQRTTKECAWKNEMCQDKSCETAPITADSNDACNRYLRGCHVNNYKKGCWKLPECSQRSLQEICGFEATNDYDCVWDMATSKCSTRTCLSTLLDTQNYKSVQSCQEYKLNASNCSKPGGIGCCTLNNQGNGCIRKPDSCSSLKTKENCGEKALFSGDDCFWVQDEQICQANECNYLKLATYDHASCYIASYKKCTANEENTKCISLMYDCSQYRPTDQCKIDNKGNQCVIKQNSQTSAYYCNEENCEDVIAQTYISFAACQSYNETCTVIAKVGSRGCVQREQFCFYYKYKQQCYKNLAGDQCVWNNNRCWDYYKIECNKLKLDNYSTVECENVVNYCQANSANDGCIKKTCNDYNTITKMTGGQKVSKLSDCWNITFNNIRCSINKALNACVEEKDRCNQYEDKIEECYSSKIEGLCMVVGTKCYQKNTSCNLWQSEDDLGCRQFREFCKYPDKSTGIVACTNRTCEEKTGNGLTEQICQDYDQSCTVSKDKTKCIFIQFGCVSYKEENLCVKSIYSNCIWQEDTTSECVGVSSSKDAEKNCQYVKGKSYEECQAFSKFCSINRLQTQCVAQKQCGSQSIQNCYISANEYCIQSQLEDLNAVCQSPGSVDCNKIFLGQSTIYTQELCSKVRSKCTNLGSSGCTDKTCENAIAVSSHQDCSKWKNSCTVNKTNTGCQEMKNYCLDQDSSSCLRTIIDGECTINRVTNLCVKKTCYSNLDAISDAQCETYMSTCTIAQPSGCMTLQPCDQYISELQCVIDKQGGLCFWNPSEEKCVLFSCDLIEQTSKFDTHTECFNLNNIQAEKENKMQRCTVKIVPDPIDKTILNKLGCINLQKCKDYKYEEQCEIDMIGQYCNWNKDNPENEFCEERTCSSAPDSLRTHLDCSKYQLAQKISDQQQCTVAVVKIEGEGLKAQGCKATAACEEYKIEDQCHYDSNQNICKWDATNQACYTKLCNKAPSTFTTHSRCNDFSSNCTVNSTLAGCIDFTLKCEDYASQDQCTKTKNGVNCNWNGSQCVTRLCSNTPDELNGDCSSYLDICESSGNQRCVTAICEQYQYTKDAECMAAGLGGKCTTDGFRCVERKSCEEARTEDACRVNNQNQQCVWNKPTATSDGYCKISICEQASQSYQNEKDCKNYNKNCTLKLPGGCKLLSDCNSFETQAGCKISMDGKECTWKEGRCISNDCSDFSGTNHFKCKSQNNKCTTSQNGKCVYMAATCAEYLIEGSCVETYYGLPCLWVKALSNVDHPLGQCIQYMKCEDIPLKTDKECRSVFQTCTSDGNKCVPIQKCENLNSSSCSLGSDGLCMYAPKDATSATKICMKFNQCQEAYYKTHQECQGINKTCTTNGSNCIQLAQICSSYTNEESCHLAQESSKPIRNCKWGKSCRDEQCADIYGATHQYCYSRMTSCTSDGTQCMKMLTCQSYNTSAQCLISYGKNGEQVVPCYWTDNTTQTGNFCQPKSCKDINPVSSSSCETIPSCVYDATKKACIDKVSVCSDYTDQTACNSGTSDSKNCYWNSSNQCSQINKCSDITDQTKCLSTKGCSYLTSNTPSCVASNCANVFQTTNSCRFYQTFKNEFKGCDLIGGECKNVDLNTLKDDKCLINSNYTYTWNTLCSKCVACINQTDICQPPDDQNKTDDSAQKVSIAMILLAMILE